MPPRKRQYDADSDGEPQSAKKSRGGGKAAGKANQELGEGQDAEGNKYWEIGPQRRAGLSEFKGKTLVNIREYYTTEDGETKPGRKGIALNLEQYRAFLKIIPQLNNELRAKGNEIENPDMAAAPPAASSKAKSPKKGKKSKKANIEETSDEEDEED